MSNDALLRVAAYYSLDPDELMAVAAGRTELDKAATQRLDKLRAAANQAAPAPAPAPMPEQEQATGAAAAPAAARSKSKRGKPKKHPAKPAEAAVDAATAAEVSAETPSLADEREMEAAIEEAASSLIKELTIDGELQIDPEVARRQEIMEEVARRRAAMDEAPEVRLRRKSDRIFAKFDVDADGYLSFKELRALGAATGGDLTELAYGAICAEVDADAKRGVTPDELFRMYTDAEMGDADRDYNIVFPR